MFQSTDVERSEFPTTIHLPGFVEHRTMTERSSSELSPLLAAKEYSEQSVFSPADLVGSARDQKSLPEEPVPDICILDPDGDLVRHLVSTGAARKDEAWPGYHTDLYRFDHEEMELGIVGCAVGAPFAVLVAEQLFTIGCEFLVSVTSSGQIVAKDNPPYFVLIERALRDEGTSHHYSAPAQHATLDPALLERVEEACASVSRPVYTGASWTTDAPFRETQSAIGAARSEGILAVEMEAAALYTFAEVREQPVVCFAYVTNQLGSDDSDFEKGDAEGSHATLEVIQAAIDGWRQAGDSEPST